MNRPRRNSWSWVVRNLLLPVGDRVFGQHIARRLRFLEETQWWPRERLREHRNRALRRLAQVAYDEVPFYRQLMDDAGVSPKAIRTPKDLKKLPVVTKDLLREAGDDRITRKTGYRAYWSYTSGSTGKNFRSRWDTRMAGRLRAIVMLELQWAGWHIGEPHMQTGMSPKRGLTKRLKDLFLRCHYVSAYDLRDEMLDRHLETLEANDIQFLFGYPGSLYYLARRAREQGWNRSLKGLATWGDNLYDHYRTTIEDAFGARVHDTYGCAEGVRVSAQCGAGDTYHIHTLDTVVEFVDEDGREVEPGETGHILLTRLNPGPMPLMRYRVGDLGIPGEGACACGRGFDTMQAIEGRDTDVVVTPSGNRLIVHFFTGILEYFSEVDSFQVVQEEPERMVLRIVPAPSYEKVTGPRIVGALREKGADLEIEIELVDEIPLTEAGKRRFVISEMEEDAGKQIESRPTASM